MFIVFINILNLLLQFFIFSFHFILFQYFVLFSFLLALFFSISISVVNSDVLALYTIIVLFIF